MKSNVQTEVMKLPAESLRDCRSERELQLFPSHTHQALLSAPKGRLPLWFISRMLGVET